MIKLESFKKSDFKQLINWINSEEFLNTMVRKCIHISFRRTAIREVYRKCKYTRFQSGR